MSTAVQVIDSAVPDALSTQAILAQVKLIQSVLTEVMIKDTHYGAIPGTGNKPTLLKAGAEKLLLTFRLDPEYESVERFLGDHLFVRSKCTLYHQTSGRRMGSGEGSCSTKETKYAYRQGVRLCPKCGKEAIIKGKEEYGGGWLCFKKKDGCGAKWPDGAKEIEGQSVERMANEDLPDQYNTVIKMANKRSLVAAVLNVTAASDIFTQDVEDLVPPVVTVKGEDGKEYKVGPVDKVNKPKEASSVLEPSTEEALSEMAAGNLAIPQDNLFDQSSAQVEHEVALKDCEVIPDKQQAIDTLQKAWDDTVKDKRLTSESRPQLYELMKRIEKKIRGRK